MTRAVTYCRVSSDEQAARDISIPAQRKALERWASQQDEVEIVEHFEDQGESAYAPAERRPGFCEMIHYCRRHEVSVILVHKLDRFSRNREESILFKGLLRRHGVVVRSITEQYDPDTPQGFLYEGMIEVINQFYSMNLATETLKGMREAAERGYFISGQAPYGYRVVVVEHAPGRDHRELVPGPAHEVEVVRRMFRMAGDEGKGARAIADALNAGREPGPRGGRWSIGTVHSLLRNPVYVGDLAWGKTRKSGRRSRERVPESEWVVAQDAHEALVDRALFQRCQEGFERRVFQSTPSARRPPTRYLLTGLIRCDCGGAFVGRRQRRERKSGEVDLYHRYYCGNYLRQGRSVCPSLPIDREWVEGLVLDALRARLCDPGAFAELEQGVRARVAARQAKYGQGEAEVQRQLADVERRIANFYRAIGEGLDPVVCREHIAELEVRRAAIQEEAAVLAREDYYTRAMEKNLSGLRDFAQVFGQRFERLPFEARRKAIEHFVERIDVVERRLLRIHLKVPMDDGGLKVLGDDAAGGGESGGKFLLDQVGGAFVC